MSKLDIAPGFFKGLERIFKVLQNIGLHPGGVAPGPRCGKDGRGESARTDDLDQMAFVVAADERDCGTAIAEKLGTVLLGQVPLVPAIRESGDAGRPIVVSAPASASAAVFRDIAQALLTRLEQTAAPRT